MPEQTAANYKGRLFLWFGAACLISSALLVPIRSSYVPLFNHQVPGLLLCHTMLALGFSWVAASTIIVQSSRQRWLPVPFLAVYAIVLGRQWVNLFL